MTTQVLASHKKRNLLQQISSWLTGPNRDAASSTSPHQQPQAIEAQFVLPFSPPLVFIDYAAEGDEPADLALIELIPPGLNDFNRPTGQNHSDEASVNNICAIAPRPMTEQEVTEAELAELIPLDLSSLDRDSDAAIRKSTHLPNSAPLPNLADLKRTRKRSSPNANDRRIHMLRA